MRSDRCYAKAIPAGDAVKEIVRHRGKQFDPYVVDAFIRCHAKIETEGDWPS